MILLTIHPSQLEALRYAFFIFLQLFLLCMVLKILTSDELDEGYVIPRPILKVVEPTTNANNASKPIKGRKYSRRTSRSISNKVLLDVIRGGNSTS